jgi:hypothetical protein
MSYGEYWQFADCGGSKYLIHQLVEKRFKSKLLGTRTTLEGN